MSTKTRFESIFMSPGVKLFIHKIYDFFKVYGGVCMIKIQHTLRAGGKDDSMLKNVWFF